MAKFNKSLLIKLSREIYIYDFIDSIDINKNEMDHISQKFLQSQTFSRLSLFRLNLKVGTLIVLFCNLYPILGKYNGTQMIIT